MQVSNSQHWRIIKYILAGLGISCLLLTIASFVLYNLVFKARFAPAADVESGQTVTVVYAKQPFDILDAMPENLLGVRKILKKDVPAYAVQDQAEAIDSLSLYRLSKGQILRSFAIRKPSGWVDYMIVARSYYSSNPARALDMLQRVIEMNPKYAHAYLWAGWCNYDLGRYEEAMRSFDKALELDSSLNNAYDGRALTLIWQGDYERAERDCNLAIQLCPSDTNAHTYKGLTYTYRSRYKKALPCFDEAIKCDAESDYAYVQRADANLNLCRFDKAIGDARAVLRLDCGGKRKATAYGIIARANIEQKRYEQAIENLEKAGKMARSYRPTATFWKGIAIALSGQPNEAVKLSQSLPDAAKKSELRAGANLIAKQYDKVLDELAGRQPVNSSWLFLFCAKACQAKNQGQKSVELLDQAIHASDNQNRGLLFFERSMAFQRLGEKDKAQADLDRSRFLDYNPSLYSWLHSS